MIATIGCTRASVAAVGAITVLLMACAPSASLPASTSPVPSQSTTQTQTPSPVHARAEVVARVPIPHPDSQAPSLSEVAVTDDAIWLLDAAVEYLVRIDLGSNEVTASTPADIATLATADGHLWAVGPRLGAGAPGPTSFTLTRLSPDSGVLEFAAQIPAGSVAAGLGAVWSLKVSPMFTVNGDVSATLVKLDPDSGQVEASWPVQGQSVFVACGRLWTFGWSESGAFMERIDDLTGMPFGVATFPQNPEGVPAMTGSRGSCWLVSSEGIQQVFADDLSDPVAVPTGASVVVVGDGLWLTTPGGLVGRFDPVTDDTAADWLLPPEDLAVNAKGMPDWLLISAGGSLWLLNGTEAVRYNIPA